MKSIKTVFLEGETGINNRIKEYVEKGSGNS